jgi:hypothetical protein
MIERIYVGEFVLAILAGEKERGSEAVLASRLVGAIRFYLKERDSGRPGWLYPAFLPERDIGELPLELDVDDDLWREFEAEAVRQGASVSQLASHAALYRAAELSAKRLAQGTPDDLDGEGA